MNNTAEQRKNGISGPLEKRAGILPRPAEGIALYQRRNPFTGLEAHDIFVRMRFDGMDIYTNGRISITGGAANEIYDNSVVIDPTPDIQELFGTELIFKKERHPTAMCGDFVRMSETKTTEIYYRFDIDFAYAVYPGAVFHAVYGFPGVVIVNSGGTVGFIRSVILHPLHNPWIPRHTEG
jgi:hypothetical protein